MTSINLDDVLDLPLGENDANAANIRGYLGALLSELIQWDESFSGKRPLGNSGWKSDLFEPLVRAGYIEGTIEVEEWDGEEEESLESCDEDAGIALLQKAISHMCGNTLKY